MPGAISLSFEREPNFFGAADIEGTFHQTIAARDIESNKLIAFGSRSVRPMYVDGKVQPVGYMSQLRVQPTYRNGMVVARGLADGFRYFHQLHQDGRAPYYLMSVIEENKAAHRLLCSGLSGYPTVRPLARLFTYAISPRRKARVVAPPDSLKLLRADDSHAERIVAFLNQTNSRFEYSPYWTVDTLFRANLKPADFLLLAEGQTIKACLASWDQSGYKQTVVRGYTGPIRRWRKVLNSFSRLGGWPHLPAPGTPLRHTFASHGAVEGENPDLFACLLSALHNYSLSRGDDYFVIGLTEGHPFRVALRRYRAQVYISQLYVVGWGDPPFPDSVFESTRPVGIEIAML